TRAARGEIGSLRLAFLATTTNYLLPPGGTGRPTTTPRTPADTPHVVQRDTSAQGLLGLVAADVGVTRLAQSASSLRRTGVAFVPLTGEFVPTEMVWLASNTSPALHALLDVVTEVAASTDFTESG
ncbi:hypothetical protein MOQ72_44205, partial [Saccharopolyspora sp. K220]|nr:hypothetical protein [Saccharopolyspora soli]